MYVTISPQKAGGHYARSVSDYANYLEKENELLSPEAQEFFFSQTEDTVAVETVIAAIDSNTAKLSRKEPRFYAITISPSKSELAALTNPSKDLKTYTRKVMEKYAKYFHREIDGRPPSVADVMYFAKVEHKRFFKGTDPEVRANQPIAAQILELKHQIRRIERGQATGPIAPLQREIQRLEERAPARVGGQRIREGMEKPGAQSHIHIIVSRKDRTNSVSLSPGSKYRASEVSFNGKQVKRGFDRDRFFTSCEKVFDTTFEYRRNFAEKYTSRKLLSQDPDRFFKALLGLPAGARSAALKALSVGGAKLPMLPAKGADIPLRITKRLKRSVARALASASIEL